MRALTLLLLTVVLLSACATPAGVASPSPSGPALTPAPPTSADACGIAPVAVPTAAPDPGYAKLDPTTDLHVTGRIQLLEPATWRLRVTGRVERPLELTYDQIRCLPKVQASPDLVCPGFFVDRATWVGVPIAEVLALARPLADATEIQLAGADGYQTTLSLKAGMDRANFLAYEWEGEPLPRLHGFPLRAVIPGAEGNQWTKWLIEIRVR
jgi:DMSO/TMAO reductase YedYZ molybdopterin-dependent catalytic subunit